LLPEPKVPNRNFHSWVRKYRGAKSPRTRKVRHWCVCVFVNDDVTDRLVDTSGPTNSALQVNSSWSGSRGQRVSTDTGRPCVTLGGRGVEDGQSWWDGCRRCFCHDGHEMCALITCPTLRCINPVLRKDTCCPTCPGMAILTLITCPTLRCINPVLRKDTCCPTCPGIAILLTAARTRSTSSSTSIAFFRFFNLSSFLLQFSCFNFQFSISCKHTMNCALYYVSERFDMS